MQTRTAQVATLIASVVAVATLAGEPSSKDGESRENEAKSDELTAEEVLANPLDEQAYSNAKRCLGTSRYRRVEIVGDRALVFHGYRGDAWLNVLRRRCPGLRPDMVLVLEQEGLRLCALDRFSALPRGGGMATVFCSLGSFEHMTTEQAQMRSDALAAQRSRMATRTRHSTTPQGSAEQGRQDRRIRCIPSLATARCPKAPSRPIR